MQHNNILRFFLVLLVLGTSIAWATETTWRHSGFEVSGYDINFSQVYNITNLRVLNFGWNSSVPPISAASKATMYYDDTAKQIKYSVNGGAYQQINDVSNAIGVLPNASLSATAANLTYSGIQTFNGAVQTAVLRSTSATGFSSGSGLEVGYVTGDSRGFVQVYNRTGSNFEKLSIDGNIIYLNQYGTGGVFMAVGAATSGTTLVLTASNEVRPLSSSNKTKHDIKNVELKEVKSVVCNITKLDVNQFKWDGNNATDYGLIADDVAIICPEIVNFASDNVTLGGVNYTKGDAISINWAALTSLELQKIKEQERRLQKVEDRGILDTMFGKQIDYLYAKLNLTKP